MGTIPELMHPPEGGLAGGVSTFAPAESDRVLLEFVLGRGRQLDGWFAWRRLTDLADVAGPTHELLPALYKRLERLEYDGPEMGRLRGIYRHHWTRSQLHRASASAASAALSASRVAHIGSADIAASDRLENPGTLSLRTPRITVRYDDSGAALEALRAAGWSIAPEEGRPPSMRARLVQTEWQLIDENGHTATVANHYNPALRDRSYETEVWERSGAEGSSVERQPAPADLWVALLSDSRAHSAAMRWAVATLGTADVLDPTRGLQTVLSAPVIRFLLPALEVRLAFLASVAPDDRTVAQALERTREELRRHDQTPPVGVNSRGGHARRAAHLSAAAVRLVHRYGGIRGTWRYLRATR